MCFCCQLYLRIEWRHVAVIMVRKEHSRRQSLAGWGGGGRPMNHRVPTPNSSDPCGGFQLVSRFMTSFFLPLVCMAFLLSSQWLLWPFVTRRRRRVHLRHRFTRKEAIRWFLQLRLSLVSLPCRVNMPRSPDDTIKFLLG